MNLGHENVGTTFGSYGYGSMSNESAVQIVQKLKDIQNGSSDSFELNDQERAVLEKVLKRIS